MPNKKLGHEIRVKQIATSERKLRSGKRTWAVEHALFINKITVITIN